MLRSRLFLSSLRQTPLRAGFNQTSSRLLLRPSPLQISKGLPRSISTSPLRTWRFSLPRQVWRSSPFRRIRNNIRSNSNKPSAQAVQESSSQQPLSFSARFKELSRKYGWAAVGVYFGLSALDFPFCFLAVRL